jgi:aromatic-L-amino-acid decarboxylase
MSGIAALAPEFRWMNAGIELADSYCTNPHKWMGVNFDCDLFWTADRAALLGALSILPEYLRSKAAETSAALDYRDWGIPLGRRFRALKLWFVLRCTGVEAIQTMIRSHVALAQELATWVGADPRFELVAPHPVSLVCCRLVGDGSRTDALIERANATGRVLFTRTVLGGRSALRISIGARLTERRHVEEAWALLQEHATVVLKNVV